MGLTHLKLIFGLKKKLCSEPEKKNSMWWLFPLAAVFLEAKPPLHYEHDTCYTTQEEVHHK